MKTMKSKLGFTLIELLIVIAIIGVLAAAFLPSLLAAPTKARDTSRVADLQKLQKVLLNGNLTGIAYPADGCVNPPLFAPYLADLGGVIPTDPYAGGPSATRSYGNTSCPAGQYRYERDPSGSANPGTYSFGLYANVENLAKANAVCATARTGTIVAPTATTAPTDLCYAILTQ